MFQIGLKIWSTNEGYIPDIIKYYHEQLYDYIELYIVPGTYERYSDIWSGINIPYVVHAAHSLGGLNPSKKEMRSINIKTFKEVKLFADKLKTGTIICHPGMEGYIDETVSQFREFNDDRIIVENKPHKGIDGVSKCIGSTPEEIKYIIGETSVGFCLDLGHAICAANSLHKDPYELIKEFIKIHPRIFHVSDGDIKSEIDLHLHFEKGNYDLKKILEFVQNGSKLTIETVKDFEDNLSDIINDVRLIKRILSN